MLGNPWIKSFSKHHNTIKIEERHPKRIKMFFNEVVPKKKCSFFTIKVVKSKTNTFAFGIIDKKEKREDKSFYSMAYDFNTGELKDSNFIRE